MRRPSQAARPPVGPPPSAIAPATSGAELPAAATPEAIRAWQALARGLHRNPDLTVDEVRALRRDIATLVKQRRRWTRSGTEAVPIGPGVAVVRPRRERSKTGGRLRGVNWRTDPRSSGPCPICYRALPHVDFAQRKYHNYMVIKKRGLKKIWAAMRAGVLRPWEVSHARARARSQARRAAVFVAEVPRVAALLGPDKVAAIVATYNVRHGYAQYRQWLRCHYGAGPKPALQGRLNLDKARRARAASADD